MKVIKQSDTSFLVEGNSLQCTNPSCRFVVSIKKGKCMVDGDICPRCGKFPVEPRMHLVDICEFDGVGQCGCEYGQMTAAPELRKMSKIERQTMPMRCIHIRRARQFALDEIIATYNEQQKNKQNKTKEQNANRNKH